LLLSKAEADAIEARIARIERTAGVQVVTAIVGRADAYPELAWKAFALGAVVAALFVVAFDIARPEWMLRYAAWSNATPILAIGGASAILTLVSPPYARLFLNGVRAAGEVRQYAQATFLERELFNTRGRNGVLLCASVFERRVEIRADVGFHGRLDERDWRTVVDAMTQALAGARPVDAFTGGLDRLEALLAAKGIAGHGDRNELPDKPITDEPA